MDLRNKIIVITGATGGIGNQLCKTLKQEGALIVPIDTKANESALALAANSDKYYVCDLSDQNQVLETAVKLKADFKSIDVLVNCAGIGVYKPLADLTIDEWNKSIAINVTAPFILTKELAPTLTNSDLALVLNIGSGMGTIPTKNRSAYCTSKFSLRGLTLTLAEEYKNSKPHFCLITLGSTLTPFGNKPLAQKQEENKQGQPYFTPDWVADKLLEVIKDEKRNVEYVWYPSDFGFGVLK